MLYAIGSVGPRFVYDTLALFIVPPLRIVRIIEHFTPRLIQGSRIFYYLFVLSHCPYDPCDAGDYNKNNYDL